MPRLEIKDLAIATTEGAAAAEDFASWEPANKDQFVWSWDVKVFPIHFFFLKFNKFADTFYDWMTRLIFQIRQC